MSYNKLIYLTTYLLKTLLSLFSHMFSTLITILTSKFSLIIKVLLSLVNHKSLTQILLTNI